MSLYNKGYSYRMIAEELEERGYTVSHMSVANFIKKPHTSALLCNVNEKTRQMLKESYSEAIENLIKLSKLDDYAIKRWEKHVDEKGTMTLEDMKTLRKLVICKQEVSEALRKAEINLS